MVYDSTDPNNPPAYDVDVIQPGYAIHKTDAAQSESGIDEYDVFTDDGRGNGNWVCRASDSYYAGRIARALDSDHGGR